MIRSGSVLYHDDLRPLMRPINTYRPHPENYNNGDVEEVMDSIIHNGMYRPIYVQRSSGFIIAGNHTWLACAELGADEAPFVVLDVDDLTALRILVADNEIARKAKADTGQLVALLERVQSMEGSLMGTGVKDHELEQLKLLNDTPLDAETGHKMWPTLCFQVPPHVKKKFYDMTEQAGGDTERFTLMLRMAGWDGKR